MKYIKINNIGEIEINAFKLIGASSKRNDSSKIGFFGSGLKYALAYFLRENTELHVFAGETKINITTRSTVHRGTEFKVIQINGEDTSLTTDMGPKWTVWGAIREIYCNAIDEGGNNIAIVDSKDIIGTADNTTFFIGVTPALMNVIENWSDYFSNDRTDIASTQNNNSILGVENEAEKNTVYYAGLERNLIVYRRGVQCHMSNSKAYFNYDFSWVHINESREIESFYRFRTQLMNFFAQNNDEQLIRTLLLALHADEHLFETSLDWESIAVLNTTTWRNAIGTKILVPRETSGWYSEKIDKSPDQYLLLPSRLVDSIVDHLPDISALGKRVGLNRFITIEKTEKHNFLIKDILAFFSDAKYDIKYPLEVVKFEDSHLTSDSHSGTIYLASHLFDRGKHALAEQVFLEHQLLETEIPRCSPVFTIILLRRQFRFWKRRPAFSCKSFNVN